MKDGRIILKRWACVIDVKREKVMRPEKGRRGSLLY